MKERGIHVVVLNQASVCECVLACVCVRRVGWGVFVRMCVCGWVWMWVCGVSELCEVVCIYGEPCC